MKTDQAVRQSIWDNAFLNRLQQQDDLLDTAYKYLASISMAQSPESASGWILDNFFLLQQTCRQIRKDMPRGFYRQLPKLKVGPLTGYARVYGIAQKLIVIDQIQLDMKRVELFIQRYQQFVTPLTMGELWALPVMLRLGLVELLIQAMSRVLPVLPGDQLPVMNLRHPLTISSVHLDIQLILLHFLIYTHCFVI